MYGKGLLQDTIDIGTRLARAGGIEESPTPWGTVGDVMCDFALAKLLQTSDSRGTMYTVSIYGTRTVGTIQDAVLRVDLKSLCREREIRENGVGIKPDQG
jgi:hypothetical protein